MGTLYDTIRQKQEAAKRVPPISPIVGGKYTPLSIQALQAPRISQAQANAEKLSSDMSRGVSLTQGTPDPIQARRQSLSGIPVIGKFLTGTGPQGPSESLYEPGSLPQSLVEKGIVGFLLEGFQKKVAPTRAEVGEQIFTRYDKLADVEPDEGRRLELAIQDVISQSPGQAKNITDLKEPGINLSEKEKDALFWTNVLEDTFAVLDAPVFVGSTKIPKNALLEFLKKTDNIDDIVPRLRMIGVGEDVANEVAPKIAKSTNEIQIARLLEDAKKAVPESTKPSLFARIQEKVATKLTPGKTNRFDEVATASKAVDETPKTVVKRTDEVTEGASERFFRSVQGGSKFDELAPDDVVPAFIREDLDTYVAKQGDEYVVIEGKTGQQIGDGGRTVAEAVQKAKTEVQSIGDERLNEFITNSPLSPRYTQVVEKAPKEAVKSMGIDLPKGIITADKLKLTDKAAARRLGKLENMARTASTVEKFVDNSGITREALESTVKKQGYKDVEQFFNTNRPKKMSAEEVRARSKEATPQDAPDLSDEYYSLLGEQVDNTGFITDVAKGESEAMIDNLRAVFADMKGIDLGDVSDIKVEFTPEEIAAREFKTADEYVASKKTRSEYGMDHSPTDGPRAFDLTEKVDGEEMIPSDMYQQWYGSRGSEADKESIDVLKKIKGNPEAEITIYRAAPRDEWNHGDWVTLSKKYAEEHKASNAPFTDEFGNTSGKNLEVFSKKVKAKDVRWAADDINEFGYFPANYEANLKKFWKNAVAKSEKKSSVNKFTEEDLEKAQLEYEFVMDSLMDDPGRALSRYVSKKEGQFLDLKNPDTAKTPGERARIEERNKRVLATSEKAFEGTKWSDVFDDPDVIREAIENYQKRRAQAQEIFDKFRKISNSIRLSKQMNTFVEVNQKKLAAEFMKNRKALSNIVEAAERAGFRKGMAKGNEKYEKLVDLLKKRRQTVSGIKFRYSLSPAEIRKAMEYAHKQMDELSIPEDPRFMKKEEFAEYVKNLEVAAHDIELRRNERGLVKAIIEQKELKNTENLREAMQLPTLSEMSLEELGRYEKVLQKFQDGDEFLSKRTLEVIDRTALKGARTVRQVQEFLSKEIKRTLGRDVEPHELANLTAGASDYLRWDTSLAESKPFYGFMVNRAQKHIMEGELSYLRIQERIEKLAAKAKASRSTANENKIKALKKELRTTTDADARVAIKKRMKALGWRANVKQKFIPTYERLINYLEARGDDKEMWWKTMTKEEQEYATFIRNYYNSAYNYLSYINELHGSRYIDAYFTHVRKGFLEKWSDDGFVAAIKNMWDAQKEDMAIANIIDSDTGKILPKSKFFQYTLERTGVGETSQNLTQVFLQYAKLLERKKMLDKMVPELDIYTSSLTPKDLTARGLEMDRTMKEFVNNYLNNKRGRKFNYGGIIKQNGPADILLRTGNTLVSFMDLGLNFLAGSASLVGEQVANFVALGNRGTLRGFKRRLWDTGMKRLVDPKASQILKEAEPFIGRNIWTEIAEVDKPIFDKAMQGIFGMFSQSSVEASKIYLLGSLTDAELKAGKISAQRMADLRIEAGRWREMGSMAKSIVGSTSTGAAWTKYKSWAIPIMRTTAKNVTDLASMLKKGEYKKALTSKQTIELMREIEVTTAALVLGSVLVAEEDDDSPIAKLRNRIKQETLTILGGVDPTVFLATPRLYSYLQQLAGNLKQLALLEEYKTDSKYGDEGDLKGLGGLKQQFTPGFIRQFLPNKSSSSSSEPSSTGNSKLDSLNKLEKLQSLEKLDKLDQLNKLEKLNKLDSL